eukprot:5673134-Alexandrium_andersonii.AAC.1
MSRLQGARPTARTAWIFAATVLCTPERRTSVAGLRCCLRGRATAGFPKAAGGSSEATETVS